MLQEDQVRILKALLARLANGTTHDAGYQVENPVSAYTLPELAQREWQTFFKNHPQIIGLSGDLPEPGRYLAIDDFGVPLIALRDRAGKFRAFVNACRHRGARLVAPGRGEALKFVCPFHGWTYQTSGELNGITEPGHFGAVDRACLKLIELPALERHGFLCVHPQPDGTLDASQLFGELDAEIASWQMHQHVFCGEKELRSRMNWKFANDTFGETYHFKRLHRDTLGRLAHGDVIDYEVFGRNHRAVFPAKSIERLHAKPEARWRIGGCATVLYYFFPNIQITVSDRQITLFRIYPEGENPGRCVTQISHYFSREALSLIESGEKTVIAGHNAYDENSRDGNAIVSPAAAMEIANSTVEEQDFRMGEAAQRTAESGLLPVFIFGRNEAPLHHFHNTYRAALGLPPLARVG